MNKLYIESESKYKEIIKKLRNNNIEKIRFFGETLKIFYNISKELIDKEKEINKNIEKISENIKVNRDIMLYDDKFYFYNDNKKRFLLVQFLDFKKFKKNTANIEKQTSNTPESNNSGSTFGNLLGFFRGNSTSSVDTNNTGNDNNNSEEIIKKNLRDKVLNLGKNNKNNIEDDDEGKADKLFIEFLLEKKEKMDEEKVNNMIIKLKKNENDLIRFM